MARGAGAGAGAIGQIRSEEDEILGKAYDSRIAGRLLSYLLSYKPLVTLSILLMLVTTGTALAGPYLVKEAVDGPITQGDYSGLVGLALLYVGVGCLQWLGNFAQTFTMSWVGQSILHTMRRQLFTHLQNLQLGFYDHFAVGRIMSRFVSDIEELNEFLSQGLIGVLADFATLIGIVILMLAMDTQLSLATFGVLPVMIVLTLIWRNWARPAYRRVRAAISRVNGALQENISGIRVVQSFARETYNMAQFDKLTHNNLEANLHAVRVSAIFFPTIEVVIAVATVMVLLFGGWQVLSGVQTVGTVIAFLLYVDRFFGPIRDLSERYNTMQTAMAGGERVFNMLDTPISIQDSPNARPLPPIAGHVTYDHVSLSYTGGEPVLKDINLDVQPGETIALVGATGAGKTSLVNLLGRFYERTGGRILVDGHDIRDVTLKSLRSQMSIVLQDPFLFSGTIEDNIRYGKLDATFGEIVEAARVVGADEFISQFPLGYKTEVHERGSRLSLGQRQLISFARALLADPRILILDEATASVDTQTEHAIQQAVERLLQGRTAFVIAHRLSTIKNSSRVVVMHYGQIVETGSHEELLAKGGLYYELYTMGFSDVSGEPRAAGRA